jgi:hypothetical protein
MKTLENQLAEYGGLQEEVFGPIALDEITSRTVTPAASQNPVLRWHPAVLATAAMVVVLLMIGGIALLTGGSNAPDPVDQPVTPSSTTPTLSSTSTPATSPTSSPIDAATWTTYESDRYGFSIGYPSDWVVLSAEHDWTMAGDADRWLSTGQEIFRSPTREVRVSAWSVALDPETPQTRAGVEAWVEQYCVQTNDPSCTGFQDRAVQLCNESRDCHPGLLVPFENDVHAFFTGGNYAGKMVVVVVWRPESDPSVAKYGGSRQLLEAFLSTMDVCPRLDETPAVCPRAATPSS